MRFIGSPKNYLSGLVGLLALAGAGCGGGGGGHSVRGGNSSNAYVTLQSWSVYDLNGAAVTCADIAARDVVVSYYNADTGTQEPFTDTFPCNNLTGTTDYLPAGNYTITVTIYGDPAVYGNNTTVLDQVQSSQLLLGGPNTLPSFNFQINAFDLAWAISVGGVATRSRVRRSNIGRVGCLLRQPVPARRVQLPLQYVRIRHERHRDGNLRHSMAGILA
jgi:hypothetical protein